MNQGDLYKSLQKWTDSLSYFQKAFALAIDDSERASLERDIALVLLKTGEIERACSTLHRAYERCPVEDTDDVYNILYLMVKQGIADEDELMSLISSLKLPEDINDKIREQITQVEQVIGFLLLFIIDELLYWEATVKHCS